jgi:hypothetical protein
MRKKYPGLNITYDGRLNRKDAADFLGVGKGTLVDWDRLGKGPPSLMVGRRRFYPVAGLESFIAGKGSRAFDGRPT